MVGAEQPDMCSKSIKHSNMFCYPHQTQLGRPTGCLLRLPPDLIKSSSACRN